MRRAIPTLQLSLFDVVKYLRPDFITFTDDDRIKESFDTIGQHRRQVTAEHNLLAGCPKLFRNIDAALQLHDLARECHYVCVTPEIDIFEVLFG